MKNIQKKIPSLISLLATTSLTVLSGGLVNPIIKSMMQTLPKAFFEAVPILKSFITKQPDNINSGIKNLFVTSVNHALDNINVLFSETNNSDDKKKESKQLIKILQKHLPDMLLNEKQIQLDKAEIKQFLYEKGNEDVICNFIENQFESLEITEPYKSFIAQNLPVQIQLCFGEGLKDPANQNAWIDFQRMLIEEMRNDIKHIADTQQSIKDDLSDLKFEKSGFSEEQIAEIRELVKILNNKKLIEVKIKDGVNQSLQSIETKANEIIKITTETNITVAQLKINIEKIGRQNKINHIIIFSLAGCLLIAGLIIAYKTINKPFTATIQIFGWENEQHHPLEGKGILVLNLGNKTEKAEINRQGEAIFKAILPEYNGKNIVAYLTDTEGEPYYLSDSMIKIEKKHITKVRVLLRGLEKLQGTIYDNISGEGVPNVSVTVANITATTDENGFFNIEIPIEKQRIEQEIEIRKEGYKSKRQTIPMSGEHIYRTILERE